MEILLTVCVDVQPENEHDFTYDGIRGFVTDAMREALKNISAFGPIKLGRLTAWNAQQLAMTIKADSFARAMRGKENEPTEQAYMLQISHVTYQEEPRDLPQEYKDWIEEKAKEICADFQEEDWDTEIRETADGCYWCVQLDMNAVILETTGSDLSWDEISAACIDGKNMDFDGFKQVAAANAIIADLHEACLNCKVEQEEA